MNESLVYFGDALKALDENGKVGGYLVRFSEAGENAKKDLSGEYFTADTYFGARNGDGVDTTFHHGQPLKFAEGSLSEEAKRELDGLRRHLFAPVKTKKDSVGIWAEIVLAMSDEYEKAVFGMVKAGKIGLSSGAVSHLVEREADGWLKRWIIGEAAMTPTPCEPLNRAVSLKALDGVKFAELIEGEGKAPAPIPDKPNGLAAKLNQHIDDLADDKGRTKEAIVAQMAREAGLDGKAVEGILDGGATPSNAKLKAFARVLDVSFDALKAFARSDHLQTIKGMFEEALAEQTPSRWELESIYCRIIKKLAAAAAASQMAGVTFDLTAKVAEATNEYTNLLQTHALAQIQTWIESGGEDDFYLKAIIDCEASAKALASSDLDTHSQLAEAVERGFYQRLRVQHEARKRESSSGTHNGQVKAGRMLSEKNRKRLDDHIKGVEALLADMRALLDESQPMADDEQKRAALSVHLRQQARNRQLGVTANV